LFYDAKGGNCFKCHGPTALGDGQQDDFDDWAKANNEFIKGTNDKLAEMQSLRTELEKAPADKKQEIKDQLEAAQKQYNERQELIATLLPSRNAIPRNLREGTLRGGRRPIDLYWRIAAGIRGMPMPATGPAGPGGQGTLNQQQI